MAARRNKPVEKPSFCDWIEAKVCLPLGLSAVPGPVRLPAYMRQICESFVEPGLERITIQKSARVGFSTALAALVAWHLKEAPAACLFVAPTEADARIFATAMLEEVFAASPELAGYLPNPSLGRSDRNTILSRKGQNGASIRLVGSTAPRNLRSIAAKIIIID
jgi:phage terminase large subunit GpA-like protein